MKMTLKLLITGGILAASVMGNTGCKITPQGQAFGVGLMRDMIVADYNAHKNPYSRPQQNYVSPQSVIMVPERTFTYMATKGWKGDLNNNKFQDINEFDAQNYFKSGENFYLVAFVNGVAGHNLNVKMTSRLGEEVKSSMLVPGNPSYMEFQASMNGDLGEYQNVEFSVDGYPGMTRSLTVVVSE